MFSAQASAPNLRVGGPAGGSVAQALAKTAPTSSRGAGSSSSGGERSGVSTAAVALATLAVIGGSLYLYTTLGTSSRRRRHRHDDEDEDEDMFSSPTGPRQLSPDAVLPSLRTQRYGAAAAPVPPVGVKGQAHHAYPKEKAASRGRSRSQAAVASAEAATPGRSHQTPPATTPRTAAQGEATGVLVAGEKGKGGSELFTTEIVKRTKAMHLVRALLERVEGLDAEESDESDTDSDETDVSLNYHIASEMELNARDDLMDAFAEYEMEMEEKMERYQIDALAGRPHEEDEAKELEDMAPVLVLMAEYLDISNEREKLRVRRSLLHSAQAARPTGETHTKFITHAEGHTSASDDDDEDAGAQQVRAAAVKQFRNDTDAMRAQTLERLMAITGASKVSVAGGNAAAMDRALAAEALEDAEVSENDWEDADDAEEEAAFMEYLQQRDDAGRFYSRQEVTQRRQDRRDPFAIRVLGADGEDFGDAMDDWLGRRGDRGGARHAHDMDDDEDYFYDGMGEDGGDAAEQEAMYRRLMGFGSDDDDDDYGTGAHGFGGESAPWTAEEKAEFEANLLERIHDMAELWGVTATEGERAIAKEEEARKKRKEARKAARGTNNDAPAAIPAAPSSSLVPPNVSNGGATAAGGEDSEEDEDEWEDVEDDAEEEEDNDDDYEDLPDDEETEEEPHPRVPARGRGRVYRF